jgi:hypothetical protein
MAEEVPQFAVITGPVVGEFTLADGTVYDVSSDAGVPVESQEHADELMYLIGLHHEKHGHPRHDRSKPFKMDRTDPKVKKFHANKSYRIHPDNTQLEG